MLSCLNLACRREEKPLFTGLGLTLLPGSLLWVSGPNGVGKSSFIKILCGILKPAAGTISWDGMPIEKHESFYEECLYIGHQNAIKPQLSVYENLAFWAGMRGMAMLVPAALHFFGLKDKADIPCAQLSAGWQRRVALARLAATPCRLWLLDEPATHLDEEGADQLATLIASRCQQGGIVIFAGHQSIGNLQPTSTLKLEDWR